MKKISLETFMKKLPLMISDVLILYKNFIHWNISKVLIAFCSFLLGVLLAIPFFLVAFVVSLLGPIDWGELIGNLALGQSVWYEVLGSFLDSPVYVAISAVFVILGVIAMILWMNYNMLLHTNLYMSYAKGKKLPYFSNLYFHRTMFCYYTKVFFRVLGYVLTPWIIFIVFFVALYALHYVWFLGEWVLVVLSLIAFVFCVLAFLYISFRFAFVYMVMLDKKDILKFDNISKVLQKSREITRWWIILPFLWVVLLFTIVFSPFHMVETYLHTNQEEAKQYLSYKTWQTKILSQEAQLDYQFLQEQFSGKTDNEIISKIIWLWRGELVFAIVSFLILQWVFQMLLVSFYMHFLVKNKKKKGIIAGIKNMFSRRGKGNIDVT